MVLFLLWELECYYNISFHTLIGVLDFVVQRVFAAYSVLIIISFSFP